MSSLTDHNRKHLADRIGEIANQLRDLASNVDRYALDIEAVPTPGRSSYASIVSNVQHDVLWGLANLHLDNLARTAAEADVARTTES